MDVTEAIRARLSERERAAFRPQASANTFRDVLLAAAEGAAPDVREVVAVWDRGRFDRSAVSTILRQYWRFERPFSYSDDKLLKCMTARSDRSEYRLLKLIKWLPEEDVRRVSRQMTDGSSRTR